MGDVWNGEYKNVALSLDEKKKMMYILSKSLTYKIKVTNDDDISSIDNMSRNFVGELMYYKEKEGLVESINAAIGSVGGKLKISDIFKVGDYVYATEGASPYYVRALIFEYDTNTKLYNVQDYVIL